MRNCSTCRLVICVDCFFAMQSRPAHQNQNLDYTHNLADKSGEISLRRPSHLKTKINARIAVIELRSLLVADAPIGIRQREYLVRRASGLAQSPEKEDWAYRTLIGFVKERFARNPETFQPSPATDDALRLLSMLQEGTL
ncbi:hypothetical protein [Mesorhizobium sp. M0011]|uniref:hypothetical protein n=1 Tax=Mesorhizobium sp. M0011 TaxID=2956839 RepID=UPI00333A6261